MSEWLAVSVVAEKTGIPEQTIRRYLKNHAHHLRIRKQHKSWAIHEEAVSVIQQIRGYYEIGMGIDQVEEALSASGKPVFVDIEEEDNVVRVELGEQLVTVQQQMALMAKVIQSMQEEVAAFRGREQALLTALPKPTDPAEERQRRITDYITQKRVETKLEEEAVALWMGKSVEQRTKKVGLFRRVEDYEQRERFIRGYVNNHLLDRLQKEYVLD